MYEYQLLFLWLYTTPFQSIVTQKAERCLLLTVCWYITYNT